MKNFNEMKAITIFRLQEFLTPKRLNKKKAVEIVLACFLLFAAGITNAQVGIGTATPVTSAQLDISSTTKGLLPPRMTQAQRNAILNPAAGLMVWCKDCGVLGEIQVCNGGAWMNMAGGYPALPIPISVVIGTQVWMTRNLDVATYRNGDTIPQVTDTTQWANLTTGAWCYLGNDSTYGGVFGKLYNWYAVNDPRGLAPAGWHIPSYEDLAKLTDYLGGNEAAGFKMKATTLWLPTLGGEAVTNESGFTGIPGGFRGQEGYFTGYKGGLFGLFSYYWTSSSLVTSPPYPVGDFAWTYTLVAFRSTAPSGDFDPIEERKGFGASVRCVKD